MKSLMEKNTIKNILLARTDHLGDLILSLPAIFALKNNYPDARLTLLVNEKYKDFLNKLFFIDEVICLKGRGFLKNLKLISYLRKQKFDLAFQLLPGSDNLGTFFILSSKAKYKVGCNFGLLGNFFDRKLDDLSIQYEVDNVFSIVKSVFPDLGFCGWGIEGKNKYLETAQMVLTRAGLKNSQEFLVIHPGVSSDPRNLRQSKKKLWPIDKFEGLINLISKYWEGKILIVGSKDEEDFAKKISKQAQNIIDLTGRLSLNELSGVIAKTKLFIGTNSGPLQLAVALGTPTVNLMGPSLFKRWAQKSNKHIVIQKKADCIPCEGANRLCNDNICMKMISVEEVFEAVNKQLNLKS